MENKEKKMEEETQLLSSDVSEKKGEEIGEEKKEEGIISRYVDMRILALFAIGVLLGFVIKTQTTETVVMGANDYKLEKTRSEYLLTDIQKQKEAEEEARLKELESEELEGVQANEEEATVENGEAESEPEEVKE